jgi:predicted nucleic acid-binding protein
LTEAPAVDASPLIHLARTGNLPLLQVLAPALVVPEPVLEEIRAKGTDDATVRAVQDMAWLSVVQPPASSSLRRWDLGKGEASVLAWALSRPGTVAVLDDQKARTYAGSLGISFIGTLGIVLRAKRQGVLSRARPVIEDLIARGMYLSRSLAEKALALVGE